MKVFGTRKRFYIPPLIALAILYIVAFISPDVDVDHVYGVCPAFTFYSDTAGGIRKDDAGITKEIIVIIQPLYRNDPVVKKHELIHVKQAYRTLFTSWFFYIFFDDYRAKAEAEAYAKTEIQNVNQIPYYAKMIKNEYKVTTDVKLIEGYLLIYYFDIL
jgi:hypothetical protein